MRHCKSKIRIIMLLAGISLFFTAANDASAQVQLQINAFTSGGTVSSSSSLTLEGSIGQPLTTSSAGNNIQAFGGLWSSFYATDLITDIKQDEHGREGVPEKFSLSSAYPNPFNPTTRISYALPKASHVKLTVYNMLGKQIRVLVNKRQQAGKFEVTFQADGLSSGMYLYRLRADNFVRERKMTLLK